MLLGGLLPWTPLALVWVSPVWRFLTRRQDIETVELRLLLWGLIPLVFYSISVGKQPRYILPVLPPLAILLAQSVLERTRDWRSLDGALVRLRRARPIVAAACIAGALLLLLAFAIWRVQPLLVNVAPLQTAIAAWVIGLMGVIVIAVGVSGAWRQVPAALALASAISFAAIQFGVLTGSGDDTVEQVARALVAARHHEEAVGTHQVLVRNLVFYSQYPGHRPHHRRADGDVPGPKRACAGRGSRRGRGAPGASPGPALRARREFPYFNRPAFACAPCFARPGA